MEPTVKISGPVSLCILHDKVRNRYFYVFGDYHFSLDKNCSQLYPGLKTDRPSFNYKGVVTTDGNAWTISALLHEVLNANGKQDIRTDYYRESSFLSHNHIYLPSNIEEYMYREQGIYKEPKSRAEVDETKKRLSESNFGWINDVDFMLFRKKYKKAAQIIDADCRAFDNRIIIPCFHPQEENEFIHQFPAAVRMFGHNGDYQEYSYKIIQLLLSFEEYVILLEQIAEDPYLFFRHFFEPLPYIQATKQLIEYLPHESELMKDLIKRLYKSIDNDIGLETRAGRVSPSAASWLKLNERQPELALLLQEFIKNELEELVRPFRLALNEVASVIELKEAIQDANNRDLLLEFIPKMASLCELSVQIGAAVMDMYVLSESLLRNAKHNIYFAGDAHAENYGKFFEIYLGYEVIERVVAGKPAVRCVESRHIADLLDIYKARELLYI